MAFFAPNAPKRSGLNGDAIQEVESALLHVLAGDVHPALASA